MSTVTGGRASATVTSGAEVNLLSTNTGTAGELGIKGMRQWAFTVNTTENVTVRVYKRVGSNVGECIISALTTVATSAAPLIIEQANNAAPAIRVTAQATGADATVNCDFYATSVLP